MTRADPRPSDLGVRVVSALVMIAVAGAALWLGGWVWRAFVALVAIGVFVEWAMICRKFSASSAALVIWLLAGLVYIGLAALMLAAIERTTYWGSTGVLMLIGAVVATDVGAYFSGRAIGGPKIAPKISPSKTWAGLIGGMLAAGAILSIPILWPLDFDRLANSWELGGERFLTGAVIAIIAQVGDFFESRMKRMAGVKDSGSLLPGHGGLLDRLDGVLAVLFVGAVTVGRDFAIFDW